MKYIHQQFCISNSSDMHVFDCKPAQGEQTTLNGSWGSNLGPFCCEVTINALN